MTGGLVQGNVEERVRTECAAYIPEEFMPKITCISDATKYLRRGLFELAIENMNDELRLIKKQNFNEKRPIPKTTGRFSLVKIDFIES